LVVGHPHAAGGGRLLGVVELAGVVGFVLHDEPLAPAVDGVAIEAEVGSGPTVGDLRR
jgi:hypothetical protein